MQDQPRDRLIMPSDIPMPRAISTFACPPGARKKAQEKSLWHSICQIASDGGAMI
jgi:hypothetical protein